MFQLEEFNAPFGRAPIPALVRVVYDGLRAALFTMVWPENDGRFSYRQLAVGTAAHTVFQVTWTLPILATGIMKGNVRLQGRELDGEEQSRGGQTPFDFHVLTPLVRYNQLVRRPLDVGMCDGDADRVADCLLLEHDPKDQLCPCPAPSCVGDILRRTGRLQAAGTAVSWIGGNAIWCLLVMITPLITFGASTWGTWWRALIAVVTLVVTILTSFQGWAAISFQFLTILPILDLQLRLHNRALSIALSHTVSYCERVLQVAGNPKVLDRAGVSPLYARLHSSFAAAWRSRLSGFHTYRLLLFMLLVGEVISATINIAGASCITAYQLGSILWIVGELLRGLVETAAANSEITTIASACRRAASDLRLLLVSYPRGHPAAVEEARRHERVVEGFVEMPGLRARFLGFEVTYAVVRGVALTAFTVAVGLWSIARGTSLSLVFESVCL